MKAPRPDRSDPLGPFRDHCKSCGDRILWAIDRTSGKRHPLNELPSFFGNITTYIEPAKGRYPARLIATVLRPNAVEGARADDRTLYRSHFADCPDARRHRQKRTKR